MSNIINYNYGESIATGFVRPKVTSLFFDKIWIPESLVDSSFEFCAIPEEVQIKEKNETENSTYPDELIRDSFSKTSELLAQAKSMNHRTVNDIDFLNAAISNTFLDSVDTEPDNIFDNASSQVFKYSTNRNNAILLSSENFNRKHRLHISPVFLDFTEFEKQAMCFAPEELCAYQDFLLNLLEPNTFLNKDVLSICVQDFPLAKEEELSWEQVLDFRKDFKRIKHLKQFTNWAKKLPPNKTPEQIREILEEELDAYKMALKEHGVKTTISAFTTVVSSASAVASMISNGDSYLYPILSITAATINFASNIYFSSYKNRNNPMAYLYNIKNDL